MIEYVPFSNNYFAGIFSKYQKYISVTTNTNTIIGSTLTYFSNDENTNTRPDPEMENTYLHFSIDAHYVIANSYILQGRTCMEVNQLKHWEFYGMNLRRKWILLDNKTQTLRYKAFSFFEIKKRIKAVAFKLQMRGEDTLGRNYLCISTINVYGTIHSLSYRDLIITQKAYRSLNIFTMTFVAFVT